ncbi:MAG: xanthine phosphoribosyltransferase [Bacillota bacterium]
MELLKQKIINEGTAIGNNIIKVDGFLNHQIDIKLFHEIGKEFKRRFESCGITRILTIEASGIAVACITASYFEVPVVFAKKHEALNIDNDTYQSEVFSFTKNKAYKIRVSKKYITPVDNVLIIDDFLANGSAAAGLADIVAQSGAKLAGVGIVIEKGFQKGRAVLEQSSVRLESLAIIKSISNGKIEFS